MRRIVIAITALLCLACAGVASAASSAPGTSTNNGYQAGFTVSGGAAKNVGVTIKETLNTSPPTGFGEPYPLSDILTKVYGLSSPYAKYFPTCTVAKINSSANFNGACPKGSLVASGTVNSQLGPSTVGNSQSGPNPTLSAALSTPCTVTLDVYNAGGGNLAYFFSVPTPTSCDGLATGAALAYPGTVKSQGGYLVNNVPEEADISFNAGNAGLWSPLISETLNWGGKVKVKGKTYSYIVSTGCKKNARPWTAQFTAANYTGTTATQTADVPAGGTLPAVTVGASAKC